ncbi:hypothetical protein RF679_07650 [Undibacterium cyanobacteriorum]|uniref:Transposase n=1 Tax=Undibacterium cyanobacteriorum TaxID=3073561 RepID=A0ABY9RN55_9BURK|nr:hypothetical protein [Undibacterium sp. 20NA77.5]WMW82149.1 hypothetical protein RF679_07650 [Undibacterium sp. 20NA77.5]
MLKLRSVKKHKQGQTAKNVNAGILVDADYNISMAVPMDVSIGVCMPRAQILRNVSEKFD